MTRSETRIQPGRLVQLIVWFASERGARLTPLRLVKFLYLADLYFARANSGATLTNWPWAFVHYGPYCGQAMQAIDDAARQGFIASILYQSKFGQDERQVYVCREIAAEFEDDLPLAVLSPLKQAIKKWGEDTPALLDHVYFETEPMMSAAPRELLNFSLARTPERDRPLQMASLSREKMEQARALVKRLREKLETQAAARRIEPDVPDETYERALLALDGEPLTAGLEGEASIKIPRDEDRE